MTDYLERASVARNLKAMLRRNRRAPRTFRGAGGTGTPVALVSSSPAGLAAGPVARPGTPVRHTRFAVDAPDFAVVGKRVLVLPA